MTEVLAVKKRIAAESRTEWSKGRISQIRPLPPQVLDIIIHFLHTVDYGCLIMAIQDGHVVKIEKNEKFIISAKSREKRYVSYDKIPGQHPVQGQIITELQDIEFGQLIIRLEHGQVEQIEKTKKHRIPELEGINGDGI